VISSWISCPASFRCSLLMRTPPSHQGTTLANGHRFNGSLLRASKACVVSAVASSLQTDSRPEPWRSSVLGPGSRTGNSALLLMPPPAGSKSGTYQSGCLARSRAV
jgi:hypothetical protein